MKFHRKRNLRRVIQYVLTILLVAALGFYAYYQSREFRRGPQVAVTFPEDGATLDEQFITLRGTAENVAFLSLNGEQIYTNTAGEFAQGLLLYPGYNIIVVEATDAFDRTYTHEIEVVVDDPGRSLDRENALAPLLSSTSSAPEPDLESTSTNPNTQPNDS